MGILARFVLCILSGKLTRQLLAQIDLSLLTPSLKHIVHFEELAARLSVATRGVCKTDITHLSLRSCRTLDDSALALLLYSVPTVSSLDLSRCVKVSDAGLRLIASHVAMNGEHLAAQKRMEDVRIGVVQVSSGPVHGDVDVLLHQRSGGTTDSGYLRGRSFAV
jgi:hypothetical protein